MDKTIFSGVQPTGNLHLGNYLGAVSQWLDYQQDYQAIFCVVDYHAITVRQDADQLRRQVLDTAKFFLASGIDPQQSTIFKQSDLKEHTELAWLLNCSVARMSDLENMTQYKDKAAKQSNPGVGLFDYPVLMAADILLYQTDLVPVGEDQIQHVELARDLAKRFNHDFGPCFKVPQYKVRQEGARIMGLDDPSKKMSKSAASAANYIALSDSPAEASKKIMRAVTDSEAKIYYDKTNKPAVANLLTIYSLISGDSLELVAERFRDSGYGDFKQSLATLVADFLTDFQAKMSKYSDDDVRDIFAAGANKLRPLAAETLSRCKQQLGL